MREKKGGLSLITLFKVNDIAILSKNDPAKNIFRFAPDGFFIIPEQNRKLIKRLLTEDIIVYPEPTPPDYTPIVEKIVNYKSPETEQQPQNLAEIGWALGAYLSNSFNSVVYDYGNKFYNWSKNSAGTIKIDNTGLSFDGQTYIQANSFSFNPNINGCIRTEIILNDKPSAFNTIVIGASNTQTTSAAVIYILSITPVENDLYTIGSCNYRVSNGGTFTRQPFNNQYKLLKNDKIAITIFLRDDKTARAYLYINDILKEQLDITIPNHTYTRCRIGANNGYTITYYNNFSLKNVFFTDTNWPSSYSIYDCISYLSF